MFVLALSKSYAEHTVFRNLLAIDNKLWYTSYTPIQLPIRRKKDETTTMTDRDKIELKSKPSIDTDPIQIWFIRRDIWLVYRRYVGYL